jgi:hypothetical protein
MPKPAMKVSKSLLDEPNAASISGGGNGSGRSSAKVDLAELQARELKWKQGLGNLSDAEAAYIFGAGTSAATVAGDKEKFGGQLFKLHEGDLIEMRVLQQLHQHLDQSPYLLAMKALYKCNSREEIARVIAEREMQKLLDDQMSAIVRPADLRTNVFTPELKKSADAWKGLY